MDINCAANDNTVLIGKCFFIKKENIIKLWTCSVMFILIDRSVQILKVHLLLKFLEE